MQLQFNNKFLPLTLSSQISSELPWYCVHLLPDADWGLSVARFLFLFPCPLLRGESPPPSLIKSYPNIYQQQKTWADAQLYNRLEHTDSAIGKYSKKEIRNITLCHLQRQCPVRVAGWNSRYSKAKNILYTGWWRIKHGLLWSDFLLLCGWMNVLLLYARSFAI